MSKVVEGMFGGRVEKGDRKIRKLGNQKVGIRNDLGLELCTVFFKVALYYECGCVFRSMLCVEYKGCRKCGLT